MPRLIPQQMGKILYLLTKDCPKKDIEKTITVFLRLVAEQQMIAKVPYIIRAFLDYAQQKEGMGTASIVSAFPLSKKQKKEIAKTFSFNEEMSVEEVDPSLLGGVIVEYQGKRVDASFKTILKRMAHQL
tara:strand:- start:754 stop:1140 length:387 start_codon:yes stop_codon:yes gene_type:complete